MQLPRRVSVTTTPLLDGWEIEEYLGPVVAHTVAGTGLFSDMFAGLSDVFGGRSDTYQRQLRSLSDNAVDAVIGQAQVRGANWVVGLTMDMDEVSGQGKQMFMVTAMGTAVRAVQRRPTPTEPTGHVLRASLEAGIAKAPQAGQVSSDELAAATRRYVILDALTSGTLSLVEETWATLIDENIVEAAPVVLRQLVEASVTGEPEVGNVALRVRAAAYFDRLDRDVAAAALYTALSGNGGEWKAAIWLIAELRLRDLSTLRELLTRPDVSVRRKALQVITAGQRTYSSDDAAHLEAIADACDSDTVFPAVTTVSAAGKGFFSSGKDRLKCQCDTERSLNEEFCYNCHLDARGFGAGLVRPEAAKNACLTEAATLRRLYSEPPLSRQH